jgi:hypothetical protein
MVSASVAVWVSEPEVPVKVMVDAADGVVMGAVSVTVAEGCADVRVRLDGLAVTPEGSPEMATEMEPLKLFCGEEVTVMALLVAPALSEREVGDAVREKSGVGLGGELPPQVVSREMAIRDAMSPSALTGVRMSGGRRRCRTYCIATAVRECHRGVIVCFLPVRLARVGLVGSEVLGFAEVGRGSVSLEWRISMST